MAAPQSVFTYALIGLDTNQTLVASVISADATATALVLNCPSGTDGSDCGVLNASVTFGQWAMATPPPSASTGTFDLHMTVPGEGTQSASASGAAATDDGNWTFNAHCQIVSTTQITVCTTTNLGGNDDGQPTATITNPAPSIYGATKVPITITAGLEKLASATATGTAAANHTGAASNSYGANMGTLGLFGLMVAFFTR